VFLDYHIYEEDINISSNWEVFLEVLDGNNDIVSRESKDNVRDFFFSLEIIGKCTFHFFIFLKTTTDILIAFYLKKI